MVYKIIRVYSAGMIVFFSLFGSSHAVTEEIADQQWNTVRDTIDESSYLINLFLNERIPGFFPETVKMRFYEIATLEDANRLLKIWINPKLRKQRPFALTLLEGLNGEDFTVLFEEYLYLATDTRAQRRLYNLITHQNSLTAFRAAVKYINHVQDNGLHREAIFYLQGVKIFKHPEIRQEIIDGTTSESSITRAASYKALRNYPDDETMDIIDTALSFDTGYIPGEENRGIPERFIKSGKAGKSLIQDILKGSKRYIEHEKEFNNKINQIDDDYDYSPLYGTVSASSTDLELAEEFAPQIRLSYGDYPGVDLKDANYSYTDYIPIYVNNATSYLLKNAYLHLHEQVTYNGDTYGPGNMPMLHFNFIGDEVFKSELNYLDFLTYWFSRGILREDGYKSLTLSPSVYFKVFKDFSKENPIAIQYWFFYYYNDWFVFDHPGDWETITIFLNENAQPRVAIYSTHYEANKYSWEIVRKIGNTPIVFVANGGHGSYSWAGESHYSFLSLDDNHEGDRELLNPSDYYLLSLSEREADDDNWVWFRGRWGDEDSAPKGPHLRTDATKEMREYAEHKPYDPEKNCDPRYAANIYGKQDNPGPWFWASGYGLDEPWLSAADCRMSNSSLSFTAILLLLLL